MAGVLAIVGVLPAGSASAASSKKPAGSPVVFHADISETGPVSVLGATEAEAMKAVAAQVNSHGGIDGHPMKLTLKNNNSTPKTSVTIASSWVSKKLPFIMVGSVLGIDTPVDSLANSAGVFCYDLSPSKIPTPTSTVFSAGPSTTDQQKVFMTFFKAKGLTKIGYINGTTTSGVTAYQYFQHWLKTKRLSGFTVTSHQTFTPSAVSVTTQMSAIKASNPQAIVIWESGAEVGTVLKAMSTLGMETIPTLIDTADASYTLLTKFSDVLPKNAYFAAGSDYVPPAKLPKGPVRKAVKTFDAAVAASGRHGGDPWALGYDPTMLLVGALRKLGIHASSKQILRYMEHLHKVAGVYGYYTTTPKTHRGLGVKNLYVVKWNGTSFVPVSGPGGAPATSTKVSSRKKKK
jgi:branched-chain amino acid transport system substrate-binding protein